MDPLQKYASKKAIGKRLAEALYGKKPVRGGVSSLEAFLLPTLGATAGGAIGRASGKKVLLKAIQDAEAARAGAKVVKRSKKPSGKVLNISDYAKVKSRGEALRGLDKAEMGLRNKQAKGIALGANVGYGVISARAILSSLKHHKALARYKKRKRNVNIGLGTGGGAGLLAALSREKK